MSVLAVGAAVPWRDLLLVYAAGITAKSLAKPRPAGLMIDEGALSVSLVASGLRVSQALAAAVLYRLVSFWLVATVGWLTLLALGCAGHAPAAGASADPRPRRYRGRQRCSTRTNSCCCTGSPARPPTGRR